MISFYQKQKIESIIKSNVLKSCRSNDIRVSIRITDEEVDIVEINRSKHQIVVPAHSV